MIRALALAFGFAAVAAAVDAPNILMLVADDWGGGDAGCYGNPDARTPVLDALAARGLRCDVAIVPAPQCAPSRAALLTGRHIWQLAEAGVHASVFPPRFATLPDRLQQAGWWVGWTGKGWGPGDWKVGGRTSDPCGPVWNSAYLNERRPDEGIANKDYTANYRAFLDARPAGTATFFFSAAMSRTAATPPEPAAATASRSRACRDTCPTRPRSVPTSPTTTARWRGWTASLARCWPSWSGVANANAPW